MEMIRIREIFSTKLEMIQGEKDSPWILLSRGRDLFLEVDDVKSRILRFIFHIIIRFKNIILKRYMNLKFTFIKFFQKI